MEWYYGHGPMVKRSTGKWEVVYSLTTLGNSFGAFFIYQDDPRAVIVEESVNGVPGRLYLKGQPLHLPEYPITEPPLNLG